MDDLRKKVMKFQAFNNQPNLLELAKLTIMLVLTINSIILVQEFHKVKHNKLKKVKENQYHQKLIDKLDKKA